LAIIFLTCDTTFSVLKHKDIHSLQTRNSGNIKKSGELFLMRENNKNETKKTKTTTATTKDEENNNTQM